MERAMYLTTLMTGGTLRFEWTRITRSRISTVLCFLPCILHPREAQQLASWADIAVMLGVIGKLRGSEIGPLGFPIGQGHIGTDACLFRRFDGLDGAILGIPRPVARRQRPAKARTNMELAQA